MCRSKYWTLTEVAMIDKTILDVLYYLNSKGTKENRFWAEKCKGNLYLTLWHQHGDPDVEKYSPKFLQVIKGDIGGQ